MRRLQGSTVLALTGILPMTALYIVSYTEILDGATEAMAIFLVIPVSMVLLAASSHLWMGEDLDG